MKLTEIVVQKAISPTLGVRTRDEVIGALMDLLVEAGEVSTDDRDDFVKAVIKRDNRGSTGFG
ncbi:MAG TPA: hypothetical protein QF455_07510, partial [Phycisphaerales bacterium]|nr:hypothetical protein [Phycisphaerales bacterium]